jgi:branched-subunit amino acid ABC-type transport system permease component
MDWVYLIEVLVGGLMSGVMYSLVAIGFVLIYKSSGIFNFAQGTMLLFASLTFVKMTENGIDFWTALFIAAGIMVIFGVATESYVIRPLANQDLLALFMATVGLATFQEGFSLFIWDSDVHGLQMNCEKPSWKVAKPTVAINKARRSWFAKGLITYRSVATPNITIMPAAMNNAVQKSIPFSVILTKVKEANKSIVP